MASFPSIIDVHKANLNKHGFTDFDDWNRSEKHLYIGRNMSFYVKGAVESEFKNPYTVKKYGLKESLKRYYEDYKNKDISKLLKYDQLGCWCHDRSDIPKSLDECECHGDVLLFILHEKFS